MSLWLPGGTGTCNEEDNSLASLLQAFPHEENHLDEGFKPRLPEPLEVFINLKLLKPVLDDTHRVTVVKNEEANVTS